MPFINVFVGPAEFDEEKISIASATGPASDISAGSSNSNEVKSSAQGATGAASIAASTSGAAASGGGATSTNNSTGRKTSRLSLHGLNVASSMSSLIKQPIEGLKNSASSSLRNSSRVNSRSLLNLFSAHNNSTTTSTNPSHLTRQGNVIFMHSSREKKALYF